jgi:hypothetical protein
MPDAPAGATPPGRANPGGVLPAPRTCNTGQPCLPAHTAATAHDASLFVLVAEHPIDAARALSSRAIGSRR